MLGIMARFATAQLDCLGAQGGVTDKNGKSTVSSCDTGLPATSTNGQLHHLLQVTLGIFAVIAVLMIVIAAMNIIYAEGDPQKVAKARGTIIYALVGLITAISAEVVVTIVAGKF